MPVPHQSVQTFQLYKPTFAPPTRYASSGRGGVIRKNYNKNYTKKNMVKLISERKKSKTSKKNTRTNKIEVGIKKSVAFHKAK